jgi:hypothetical protein
VSLPPVPTAYTYFGPSVPLGLTAVTPTLPGVTPATTARVTTKATSTLTPLQREYQLLQQVDTIELLQMSFSLTPEQATANANSVFAQVTALQKQQQTARAKQVQANADAAVLGRPATPLQTGTTASKRISYTDLIAQSDAAAKAALAKFSKAPPGSSILDFQA